MAFFLSYVSVRHSVQHLYLRNNCFMWVVSHTKVNEIKHREWILMKAYVQRLGD